VSEEARERFSAVVVMARRHVETKRRRLSSWADVLRRTA
jgi:hypothetical protein